MPRTLSSHNASEIGNLPSRPHWVVQLDFSTVIRLSTRGTVTWNSLSWSGANMDVSIAGDGLSGTLGIFDEGNFLIDDLILEGAAGIPVTVWMLFGESPWGAGDADIYFEGELGPCTHTRGRASLSLVQPESRFAPRWLINQDNGFNHLPPEGTVVSTPDGLLILRNV